MPSCMFVFQWSLTQVVPGAWVKAWVLKSTRWEQKWQLWDDGSYRHPGKVKDLPRAEFPPTLWGSCSLGPGTCGCGVTGLAYTPARWIPSSQQLGGMKRKEAHLVFRTTAVNTCSLSLQTPMSRTVSLPPSLMVPRSDRCLRTCREVCGWKENARMGTIFCLSSCLTMLWLLSLSIPNPGFHSLAELS